MPQKNQGAFLHGVNDIRLENIPVDSVGDNDVLIAVHQVGVCGSDIHYYKMGTIGGIFSLEPPEIMGHEGSGLVEAVGRNVTNLKKGDPVAMEPVISCGSCPFCLRGRYNLCEDSGAPVDGFLKRYHVHPAGFCHRIPPGISLEEAAVAQPVTIALQSSKMAKLRGGQNVLVLGAGPIGLLHLLVAKAMGVSQVAITDLDSYRLSLAKELGADHIFKIEPEHLSDSKKCAANVVSTIGFEPDVVFECSGAEASMQLGVYACKPGGSMTITGLSHDDVMAVPMITAAIKEIRIVGVYRSCNEFRHAIDLIAKGRINVKPLISHRLPLDQAKDAFHAASSRSNNAVKVMINCNQ